MVEDSIKERLKHEVIGIVLIAAGIVLFLSLISYDPIDPSFFSHTSSKVKEIHNWMGIVGFYISGFLFQGFGFPSFLAPLCLGLLAFGFIFRRELKYPPIRLIGWLILLLTTSSLFALWLKPIQFHHEELRMGGFVGEILSRGLVRYFNFPGASVLLLVVFILSFVLGTGISFIALLRHLGAEISDLAEKIGTLKMVRKERTQRARKLEKQKQEKEKGGEVPLPTVIDASSSSPPPKEIVEQKTLPLPIPGRPFSFPRSLCSKPIPRSGRRSIATA